MVENISGIFQKTNIIKVSRDLKQFIVNKESILDLFLGVIEKEEEFGHSEPAFDRWLWKSFKNKTSSSIVDDFEVPIYRLNLKSNHQEILDEIRKIEVKKIFTYREALNVLRSAILAGEVKKGQRGGIIVYFSTNGSNLHYLRASRFHHDHLCIDHTEVFLSCKLNPENGICY